MKKVNRSPYHSFIILVLLAILVTQLLTTAGCASAPVEAKVVHSDLARETSPQVNDFDLHQVVAGNTTFAFQLFQALREKEGNLFYSPYSISIALAMTYAGARGKTEREMMDTLAFSLPQQRLHPAFNALDLELASRAEPIETVVGKQDGPELVVANSLWGQVGYSFLPDFLDTLAVNYSAGMQLVDYVKDADAARRAINAWVSDQTKRKIKDVVPPDALDANTRLVLANAIFFNAKWDETFKRSRTDTAPFYLLDGDQINVRMMHQDDIYLYARGGGFQLIELPYVQRDIVMDILLPDAGAFHEVEASLDAVQVRSILRGLDYQGVSLALPRFGFESVFSLSDTLAEMGMPSAFSSAADFSGMDGTHDLEISEVLHKAWVYVDEDGTEAAAATTVFADVISGLGPTIEVTIDRPFIFWIRDLPTGTILFVGRVLNPVR